MQRKCPFKTCRHTLLACEETAVYSSHRGGAKKGVTSKCDAYDIKYSSKSLVVPRPWNLQEKSGTSRFWSRPQNHQEKSQNLRTLVATSLNNEYRQELNKTK
jgi:hypothetical protein